MRKLKGWPATYNVVRFTLDGTEWQGTILDRDEGRTWAHA